MSYKNINYQNMEVFADELKKKYAKKTDLAALQTKVDGIISAGGEPNVIEGVSVNGALLTLANKVADIIITESSTNGAIKVNDVDVAVHGLAALAYKAEVSESDLATALKASIDAKAKQADLDILTGDGEGSVTKMIDAAFNDFSTKVTDDGVVNSYKELIDWAASHGSKATELAGGISANTTAINDLKALVGNLPEDATATTVIGYIAEAVEALSIGDYAKTTEVTAAISTALADYYTKTEADAKFVKVTDIETVTEAEMRGLLADDAE